MHNAPAVLIVSSVLIACILMGIVDAILRPGYVAKSLIKIFLFLFFPLLYKKKDPTFSFKKLLKPTKRGFTIALLLGAGVYLLILGAYFLTRNIFDFSGLTVSLTNTTGVNKNNFLAVALYISFVNSLLEEIFFRGFSFITLKKVSGKKFSYIFSSAAFALYHIAMMIGWFALPLVLAALAGLFLGGFLFNKFDEKNENVILSWIIHMFANFSINTIGFLLFDAS